MAEHDLRTQGERYACDLLTGDRLRPGRGPIHEHHRAGHRSVLVRGVARVLPGADRPGAVDRRRHRASSRVAGGVLTGRLAPPTSGRIRRRSACGSGWERPPSDRSRTRPSTPTGTAPATTSCWRWPIAPGGWAGRRSAPTSPDRSAPAPPFLLTRPLTRAARPPKGRAAPELAVDRAGQLTWAASACRSRCGPTRR